jgi:hypothetical protein
MKTMMISVALAAAYVALLGVGAPAAAQLRAPAPTSDRCDWQAQRQVGPRAPLRAPVCKKAVHEFTGIGGPECRPQDEGKPGHYEWVSSSRPGPRAAVKAPVRVWFEC